MLSRPLRPSANKTRSKIIDAAKALFLEKGFDNTQIKDIANLAKVNTNLIFHHFANKLGLWHKVKDHCLAVDLAKPEYDISSGKRLFKTILDYRFDLYMKHPEFTQLVKWESLANQEKDLISEEFYSPLQWLPLVEQLQKQGEIKKTMSAEQIMLFIIYSSHVPFWQDTIAFNQQDTKKYKNMLFEMCCQQFLT